MEIIETIQQKIATQIVQAQLVERSGATLLSQLKNLPQVNSENVEEVLSEAIEGRSYYNWHGNEMPTRVNIEEKIGIVIIEFLHTVNGSRLSEEEKIKVVSEILKEAQSHLNIASKLNPASLSQCLTDCEKLVKNDAQFTEITQEAKDYFKDQLKQRIDALHQNQRNEESKLRDQKKFPNKKADTSAQISPVELKIDRENRLLHKELLLKVLNSELTKNPAGKKSDLIKDIIEIVKEIDPEGDPVQVSRTFVGIKHLIEHWDILEGVKTPKQLVLQQLAWFLSDLAVADWQRELAGTSSFIMEDRFTRDTIRDALAGRPLRDFTAYFKSLTEEQKAEGEEAINLIQTINSASPESIESILKDALKSKGIFSAYSSTPRLARYLKKALDLNKLEKPENRNNQDTLKIIGIFRNPPYNLATSFIFLNYLDALSKVPEVNQFLAPITNNVPKKPSMLKVPETHSAASMKDELKVIRIDPEKRKENRDIALRIIEELRKYPKEAGGNEWMLENIEKIIKAIDLENPTDVTQSFAKIKLLVLNWEMQSGSKNPLYLAEKPLSWFLSRLGSKDENLLQRMMKYSKIEDEDKLGSGILYQYDVLYDFEGEKDYQTDNADIIKARQLIHAIDDIAKDTALSFHDRQQKIISLLKENLDTSLWDKLNPDPVSLNKYIEKSIEIASLPEDTELFSKRLLNFVFAFNRATNFKDLLEAVSDDFHEIIVAEMNQKDGYQM
ncbi:hypothetical protein [Legionella genomosp. 1]|uniref:hypothetical protein n=1 Tax=Legionella genomosp. 1 TaxID=1093625 RepID=UPI0010542AD1|nr:hypothetical protein [Legionella genomosp. 1]